MLIKLHKKSYIFFQQFIDFLTACFVGVWVGLLDRDTLHQIDQQFYDSEKIYRDEEYNQSGLWDWEFKVVQTYFQACKTILLAGAGGGREILSLNALGYEVDAFECNPGFVKFANELLSRKGVNCIVQFAPRDTCPNYEKIYDGLIVGWGAYTLIQGRENRIDFLKQMRSHVKNEAPILISFLYCYKSPKYYSIISAIANFIRRLSFKPRAEVGDFILPENFVHYFSKEQIASELAEAEFRMEFYSTNGYGHAIGIAKEESVANQ